MAKKSQRRLLRQEKDHLGCMWGLISMFDFRRGGYAQKLLSDKSRGSRNVVAARYPKSKLKLLTGSKENCPGTINGDETSIAKTDASKLSVKKLIEEEMVNEDTKKQISISEVEKSRSKSESGGHIRRNRKRLNKTDVQDIEPLENLGSVDSTTDQNINSIVEEICNQIQQKSISCIQHDQQDEINMQSNPKPSDFEEQVREVTTMVISQKFIRGELHTEDGKVQESKELMDAIEILFSNKELFKELLEDPNSMLMKHIKNLQGNTVDPDEKTKSLAGCNFSEEDPRNLRQSEEHNDRKYHYFFRRKVRSQPINSSNGFENPQASSKIVILKPGQAGLRDSGTTLGPSDRAVSHFSLTEIKRKLKQAIGKEPMGISRDGITRRNPCDHQKLRVSDKGVVGENFGRKSPSREHFYTERIPKHVIDIYRGDNSGKAEKCDKILEHGTDGLSKQRVSNIYIEAKKHLSEMLTHGDEDGVEDSSRRQVPKTLGKILSLPEYNFSPLCSPRKDWEDGFVTAKMKFSAHNETQKDTENLEQLKQDYNLSHVGRSASNSETESCTSEDSSSDKGEAPLSGLSISEEVKDDKMEEISCPVPEVTSSEGGSENLCTNYTIPQEENNSVDVSFEPSNLTVTRDNQNDDLRGERTNSEYIEQDMYDEDQVPSSPLTSPSSSLNTMKIEDLELAIDRTERPSPVSILEPVFSEDDISPASTKALPVELPIEPLCIQFQEYDLSTADQSTRTNTSLDYKETMFKYVKAVLLASGLCWDKFYMVILSDHFVNPSLLDQVDFPSNQLPFDRNLLFDCINEVLVEVCLQYFGGSPWVQYVKSNVRPLPDTENAIREVWEGVEWHVLPQFPPRSLDQLIKKDLAKNGTWMDLRFDVEGISAEMSDLILDELMDDTILRCKGGTVDEEGAAVSAKMKEDESSTNL